MHSNCSYVECAHLSIDAAHRYASPGPAASPATLLFERAFCKLFW